MTSTSGSQEHVIKKSVKICRSDDEDDDENVDDARQKLGTEAIEQLASGLNLAAHTIKEYSQNTIDDENLKQLNDEQLFKLLEEAYHSKKLDEKNKSAIFKEILEDVHESLATPDNNIPAKESNNTLSSSNKSCSNNLTSSLNYNKSSHHQSAKNNRASSFKNAAQTYDSIAALTEIMDPSSSHITIPASAGGGIQTRNNVNDPDADSSSTKTEVEEMELDQFSDGEDNNGAGAKRLDENGNPSVTSSSGSVSFAARQLKPLSIYRHNPAFHSQHVSVNQMDEIPSLSPTSLQPTTQIPSTSCSKDSESKNQSSKSRRKKKAVKTEEATIKAEEIDGYRGGDDLESLLQFIDGSPTNKSNNNKSSNHHNLESKTSQSASNTNNQASTSSSDNSAQNKSKRSRRTDRKSKRSRTPSITTSNKEKSPEYLKSTSQSQSQSRASSTCASKIPVQQQQLPFPPEIPPKIIPKDPPPDEPTKISSNPSTTVTIPNNNQKIDITKSNPSEPEQKQEFRENDFTKKQPEIPPTPPDSVTTVKHSLIVSNNNNNKKTLKKPKKQAGWLVDLNNETTGKVRLKAKPPTGKSATGLLDIIPTDLKSEKNSSDNNPSVEIISDNTNSSTVDIIPDNISSEEPTSVSGSVQDFGLVCSGGSRNNSEEVNSEDLSPDDELSTTEENKNNNHLLIMQQAQEEIKVKMENQQKIQPELCFNYGSILKFVKREWNAVDKEISNGSNDIQSKVVYYRPREKI